MLSLYKKCPNRVVYSSSRLELTIKLLIDSVLIYLRVGIFTHPQI